MTKEEVLNALDGLMAYDRGSTDSGIHDERLRKRVQEWLHADADRSTEMLREWFRSLLDPPYGPEDVAGTIRWLADEMGFDL